MATKPLVQDVAVKQDTGDLSTPVSMGASFANVIDQRIGKEPYTLAQFFDSYMEFMQNADFIYQGASAPTNSHVKIWIDTGHSNQ